MDKKRVWIPKKLLTAMILSAILFIGFFLLFPMLFRDHASFLAALLFLPIYAAISYSATLFYPKGMTLRYWLISSCILLKYA